jgi:hypothetical protein
MVAMEDDVRRHGILVPVPVDYFQDPPKVLDGHTRLAIAKRLGLRDVPTQNYDEFLYHLDFPY